MGAFFKFIAVLLILSIGGVVGGWFFLQKWSATPVEVEAAEVINFPPGTSLDTLGARLEEKSVVTSRQLFKFLVRLKGNYGQFQAGTYKFEGSFSPLQVVATIIDGKTWVPIALQVTIPEGWNLKQIVGRLVEAKVGTREELSNLTRNQGFLRSLKIDAPTMEGFVYPATYIFSKFPTGREVFTKAVQTFWEKLPADYVAHVKDRGFSLQQAVTFASLIELETAAQDEKSLISEVIWRRLKDGNPLGIDAALIYGIPDYQGDILWRHLKDRTNLYNTRIHHGLPPTPIGSVSAASLEAVLVPANLGNYYYVLDLSSGKPKHHFSKSLAEHQMYVKKLVQALNARKNSSADELKTVKAPVSQDGANEERGIAP